MDHAKSVADQGSVYPLYALKVKRGNKDIRCLKESSSYFSCLEALFSEYY